MMGTRTGGQKSSCISITSKAGLNGSPDADTAIFLEALRTYGCYLKPMPFFTVDLVCSMNDARQPPLTCGVGNTRLNSARIENVWSCASLQCQCDGQGLSLHETIHFGYSYIAATIRSMKKHKCVPCESHQYQKLPLSLMAWLLLL